MKQNKAININKKVGKLLTRLDYIETKLLYLSDVKFNSTDDLFQINFGTYKNLSYIINKQQSKIVLKMIVFDLNKEKAEIEHELDNLLKSGDK